MPKRNDISSILIIGAGPIVIGQACEFDYSGTQACKALKEEGYRVILINSNPATIMTDPEIADSTYVEPINTETVEKIIKKEKPCAILPTMGGQTALNIAIELEVKGILKKENVKLIGATKSAIEKAEDRKKFRNCMEKLGIKSPKSVIIEKFDDAEIALNQIGLPAIIRPAFTLGGAGGGIAYNIKDFYQICKNGLEISPANQVLIDESLLGWKEFELEVVRDQKDNAIIICSIENFDTMGVHTGDSITVAPALTLTAINPDDGRMVVIEMNPRVSRSSALASKATGFPIAKIAAKLAIGYTLNELQNDITGTTPASFEPSIDYVVTKIPRFTFEKFPGTSSELGSSMKSVGEVMSIGRSFHESLQKALTSLDIGLCGLNEVDMPKDPLGMINILSKQNPQRILQISQAIRNGMELSHINEITKIDMWFLERINEIIKVEKYIKKNKLPNDKNKLFYIKSLGFTDERLSCYHHLK